MKRISVGGTTGSGKTTFSAALAQRLSVPHIELDALNWDPNWTAVAPEALQQRVIEAIAGDTWIVEGGYSRVRPLIWQRADTVVWLDYSFLFTFMRLCRRTMRRTLTREELWNGNRESLLQACSRDSIILWLFKSYHRQRRQLSQLLAQPEYSHLRLLHFKSPRGAEAWLRHVHQHQLSDIRDLPSG